MPILSQTSIEGPFHVVTIAPAFVTFLLDTPARLELPVLLLPSFPSLSTTMLAPRLVPVLHWLDNSRLCWFLPLPPSHILVQS